MNNIEKIMIMLLVFLVCYLWISEKFMKKTVTNIDSEELMAPLDTGTYDTGVQYGVCNKGSFEKSSCSVGNCPLETTVTDDRYCAIQCAQEVDDADRKKCHAYCMKMIKGCQ